MADEQKGGGSSAGIITLMVVILLVLFAAGAAFGLGGVANQGPTRNGATVAHAADPTDPSYQNLTGQIKIAADPGSGIAQRKESITVILTQLDAWTATLGSSTTVTVVNRQNALNYIQQARAILSAIQTATIGGSASPQQKADLEAKQDQLVDLSAKIRQAVYSTGPQLQKALDTAASIIQQNNDGKLLNGVHPIPFHYEDNRQGVSQGLDRRGVDCSHFITAVLQSGGVMAPGLYYTSLQFPNHFKQVDVARSATEQTNDDIENDDVQLDLTKVKGEIQPGDLLVVSQGHVYMFYGNGPSGPYTVVESGSGTLNGPHFTSLDQKFSEGGSTTKYLLRPNYAS